MKINVIITLSDLVWCGLSSRIEPNLVLTKIAKHSVAKAKIVVIQFEEHLTSKYMYFISQIIIMHLSVSNY